MEIHDKFQSKIFVVSDITVFICAFAWTRAVVISIGQPESATQWYRKVWHLAMRKFLVSCQFRSLTREPGFREILLQSPLTPLDVCLLFWNIIYQSFGYHITDLVCSTQDYNLVATVNESSSVGRKWTNTIICNACFIPNNLIELLLNFTLKFRINENLKR